MRKKLCCFLILIFIFAIFAGCKQNDAPQISATDGSEPATVPTTKPTDPTTEATKQPTTEPSQKPTVETTATTAPTEAPTNSTPSGPQKITDGRVAIIEGKRIYNDLVAKFTLPLDWECLIHQHEDGSLLYFRHPELGENCQLFMNVTGSWHIYDRTKDEYLKYISYGVENVKLEYYEKETLKGYRCIKAVYTYMKDNTEFVNIHYNNIIFGYRKTDFLITYPVSQSDKYKDVFEAIIDSVEFNNKENDEFLLDFLHNKAPFIDEAYNYVYLKDYKPGAEEGVLNDVSFIPQKYALIDMDGDGKNELVISSNSDYTAYMVFHDYHGCEFSAREMHELKADGSFMQSSSAAIINVMTLNFNSFPYEFVVKAYKNDLDRIYKLGDKPTTVYAVQEFIDYFNKKPEVEWVYLNSN